jgi:CTP synthase (UTP-ammonia lyase)
MLTVGIIGDFDPASETHRATNEALRHAAHAIDTTVTASWLPTNELHTGAMERALRSFDALWAAPGSPYRDMGGALRAIQFACARAGMAVLRHLRRLPTCSGRVCAQRAQYL